MQQNKHTDQGYDQELNNIRQRLLLMAGRVEGMIAAAIRAYREQDTHLAKQTIAADHAVNQDEIDLDAQCLELLACRQPMASDLRFITLTLKMVTDLERIADLTVSICERTIDLQSETQRIANIDDDIVDMGNRVSHMVHQVINAFVEKDLASANDVITQDDAIDSLYRDVFRGVLQSMIEENWPIQRGIHIQSVAKYLERIADHTTNLAEQVIFMVKGTDIRHEGKLL